MQNKVFKVRNILLVLSLFLIGCTTNVYLDESKLSSFPVHYEERVFVVNPQIGEPFNVVEQAEIYDIQYDYNTKSRLVLNDIDVDYVCGNPLIVSVVFLGLVPVALPYTHRISYAIQHDNVVDHYEHVIPLYTRTSIWEWLFKPFTSSDADLLVKGLSRANRVNVN